MPFCPAPLFYLFLASQIWYYNFIQLIISLPRFVFFFAHHSAIWILIPLDYSGSTVMGFYFPFNVLGMLSSSGFLHLLCPVPWNAFPLICIGCFITFSVTYSVTFSGSSTFFKIANPLYLFTSFLFPSLFLSIVFITTCHIMYFI